MSEREPPAHVLLSLLPGIGRGPKREGVFALWLTLRVAQDFHLDPPLPERQVKRRISALATRLSSLTLPAPLRRALNATVLQLASAKPEEIAQILSQLVAPAREATGAEAAEAIGQAVVVARARWRER
ncbi:MAG TPA: hypothetical protein VJN95_06310 [Gemmatimonadales bacterium]|nr:hypothetical protein [Gemmatimonadales bacterium]